MRILFTILIIALCLSFSIANSAELTATVDPDGTGDYDNLNAALTALEGDLTDNGGDTVVITCICTGGTPDTTPVVFGAGWVTSADYDITIEVDPDYYHGGIFRASGNYYRMGGASSRQIEVNGASYLTLRGLQILLVDSSNRRGINIDLNNDGVTNIDRCLINGNDPDLSNTETYAISMSEPGHTTNLTNCIIYDVATYGIRHLSGEMNVYNTTIYNCGVGYYETTSNINCIAAACTDGYSITSPSGNNNNVDQSQGDSPGSPDYDGTVTFVDATGSPRDLHLSTSDTVVLGNGADLSAIFTTDIDGDTRSDWDIGADEAENEEEPVEIITKDYWDSYDIYIGGN